MNLALQSPVYFLCKHLFPNHVPIQSRKFCRLCSHLLRHCGRPSHDEQPVKQINKTGSSWIYPKIGSSFSPEHHTNVFQYSNYWNNELYVIHNLIIWVSEYACKLILDIIIHSKYFLIFDWLKPHAYWIHHNQLLLTKFAKNFVIFNRSSVTSKVQPAADYWIIDRENLLLFNKERNGCDLVYKFERRTYFEWIIMQL